MSMSRTSIRSGHLLRARSPRDAVRTDTKPIVSRKRILLIADTPVNQERVHSILSGLYKIETVPIERDPVPLQRVDAIVVVADLRDVNALLSLRRWPLLSCGITSRIFISMNRSRLSTAQAYALGATHVVFEPERAEDIRPYIEGMQCCGGATEVAAFESLNHLRGLFSEADAGAGIDLHPLVGAADAVINAITQDGLASWLDVVRRHHHGTYQHCLLVAGTIVGFGLGLGFSRADNQRLYVSAMFHDIGKTQIPISVLDKPGRLDTTERRLIETHPVRGCQILEEIPGISAEIVDCVRHHHEYLDGTGYPDGLSGAEISDIVRMLTISDIFSALVESRSYKAPLHPAQAYRILDGMAPKLERSLVAAFQKVTDLG